MKCYSLTLEAVGGRWIARIPTARENIECDGALPIEALVAAVTRLAQQQDKPDTLRIQNGP